MKKGTVLVVLGLCLTFLVFGISRIRASADENDRIMSVVAPIQDLSMKTSQDLKVLNEMGIVIAPCEEDTLISEEQAKQIAIRILKKRFSVVTAKKQQKLLHSRQRTIIYTI